MTVSKLPDGWVATVDNNIRLAKLLDDAGIDFMLPIARWIGYGGETDFHGTVLETMTWAAIMLAHTQRLTVLPRYTPPRTTRWCLPSSWRRCRKPPTGGSD